MQDGPSDHAETPVHAHAGPLPGEPEGEYFYSLRDTDINGPCSGKTILEVVKVLSSAGAMTPDSIYIYNSSITKNDWEPWSPGLLNKIAVDTALVASARRVRISASSTPSSAHISTPYVSSDASTVPMASIASGTARSLDFGSPGSSTSARDRELGQQRPCTRDADLAAYHSIISAIDDSGEAGEMLILTIGTKFDGKESGHELYNYLDERASCGRGKEGIINADELKRKVDDYMLCEDKLITIEQLTLGIDHFQRLWEAQPIQRQGMNGDMFDAFAKKLPHNPFNKQFIPNMNAVNALSDGLMHSDYKQATSQLRALYAQWLKTNSPVKGKGSTTSTHSGDHPHALVGDQGKGKGKGKGSWGRGGGKGGGKGGIRHCFRCWKKNDHFSGSCPEPPGVCTACGMDSAKAMLSCDGEQDPRRCIIKGFRPEGGVSPFYLARLADWAKANSVKLVEPSSARALAASYAPSSAGAQSYAASVIGPCDSISVAGGESMALAASQGFDPNNVSWTVVDGMWRPAGNGRTALVAPIALVAFGGRTPLEGEIDCMVDGGCTGFCVPNDELLVNLRPPEIDGMHVGNNNWCPATATGDLVSWTVDSDGIVHEFTRVRHVVPDLKWHLHGETPEFEEYGGVVIKRARSSPCACSTTQHCHFFLEVTAWCGYLSSARASSRKSLPTRSSACMSLHALTQRALSRVCSRRGAARRWWDSLSALSRPISTCSGTPSSGAGATTRSAPRSPTPSGTVPCRCRMTPAATLGCAISATRRS